MPISTPCYANNATSGEPVEIEIGVTDGGCHSPVETPVEMRRDAPLTHWNRYLLALSFLISVMFHINNVA